jgi:Flp pilus assembly protein TadG
MLVILDARVDFGHPVAMGLVTQVGWGTLMRRRRGQGDSGATAVEFALIMLPLLYLVFGVIQYGLYFYAMQSGTSAVGEATRRLTVGNCQTTSELQQFLADRLGSATTNTAAQLNPQVTYEDAATPPAPTGAPGVVGGSVTLTLTFSTHDLNFPFIPLPNGGDVTRTAFGRVEDTTSTPGGCS